MNSAIFTYAGGVASQSWYGENANYNYTTGTSIVSGQVIGHFTAMIWKNAKYIGIGVSEAYVNGYYVAVVVTEYSPVTNVLRQYIQNVPKPLY
jgi:uncharacterized protein YkwD